MKAIILAAGKSTRTYPLTLETPKALLRICNKPIMQWTLGAVAPVVDEIIIVVGFKKEMIMAAFGDQFQGVPIRYISQQVQNGTGGAVQICREFLNGDFIVLYGDDLYGPSDVARIANEPGVNLLAAPVEDISKFGAVITDDQGNFVEIIEKSKTANTNLANTGCMKLTQEVFEYELPLSARGEYELTDYVTYMGRKPGVKVVTTEEYWKPIGYPWDIYTVNFWMKARMQNDENIIGENTEIASTAILENCIIEDGARVGENSHLENCIVMADCIVPEKTIRRGGQNAIISPVCDILIHSSLRTQ